MDAFDVEIRQREAKWWLELKPQAATATMELEATQDRLESLLRLRVRLLEDGQRLPLMHLTATSELEAASSDLSPGDGNSPDPTSDSSTVGNGVQAGSEVSGVREMHSTSSESADSPAHVTGLRGSWRAEEPMLLDPLTCSEADPSVKGATRPDLPNVPAYVSIADLSIGSREHGVSCRPCSFFHSPGGCSRGKSCRFCHLCSAGIAKKRRVKLRIGVKSAAQLEEQIREQQEVAYDLGLQVAAARQRLLMADQEAKEVQGLALAAEKEYQDEMHDAAMRDFRRTQAKALAQDAAHIRETASRLIAWSLAAMVFVDTAFSIIGI
ncbi:unnamed protein product [Symbiodinium natans]|uniref:C3H1-type domain-containing protein n=1 Tax=Symbiodinium natans TaxID=878477 RepID=A0A812T3X7_9DINO|nr:unnamed protein product [Symbiodinium natans]